MRAPPTASENSGIVTHTHPRPRRPHTSSTNAAAIAAVSMACPLGKLNVCSGRMLAHSAGRGRATSGLTTCVSSIDPPTERKNTAAARHCRRPSSPRNTNSPRPTIGPVLPMMVRNTARLSSPGVAWRCQNSRMGASQGKPPKRSTAKASQPKVIPATSPVSRRAPRAGTGVGTERRDAIMKQATEKNVPASNNAGG